MYRTAASLGTGKSGSGGGMISTKPGIFVDAATGKKNWFGKNSAWFESKWPSFEDKAQPIFTTPPSIIFSDLVLVPGQSKSCTYSNAVMD